VWGGAGLGCGPSATRPFCFFPLNAGDPKNKKIPPPPLSQVQHGRYIRRLLLQPAGRRDQVLHAGA
jgi:hypothetical protein